MFKLLRDDHQSAAQEALDFVLRRLLGLILRGLQGGFQLLQEHGDELFNVGVVLLAGSSDDGVDSLVDGQTQVDVTQVVGLAGGGQESVDEVGEVRREGAVVGVLFESTGEL